MIYNLYLFRVYKTPIKHLDYIEFCMVGRTLMGTKRLIRKIYRNFEKMGYPLLTLELQSTVDTNWYKKTAEKVRSVLVYNPYVREDEGNKSILDDLFAPLEYTFVGLAVRDSDVYLDLIRSYSRGIK